MRSKNIPYHILDHIFIFSLITAVLLFIAVPFAFVFKEGLLINGKFSLALVHTVVTKHLYLLKNSLLVGIGTTLLTTAAATAVAIFMYMSPKSCKCSSFLSLQSP